MRNGGWCVHEESRRGISLTASEAELLAVQVDRQKLKTGLCVFGEPHSMIHDGSRPLPS
jgi:hypothetical protein